MSRSHALVTGGAGFIGSWVVRTLLSRGWTVRVLDNLSTGASERVPREAELIVGEIGDPDTVRRALEGCQTVFHLAAFTVVGESASRAAECCQTNVAGAANLFQLAAASGTVKRIIFSSSSAVYAGRLEEPLDESTPLEPDSVYGETKAAGEHLLTLIAAASGINGVALRYFNVYGPGQTAYSAYPSVVPAFLTRIEQGRPLVIHGDGWQTRDFVYVEDVARANVLAAEASLPDRVAAFNIATGTSLAVMELARKINRLAGRPEASIEHDAPVPGEQRHNRARIERVQRDLGWRAQTGLDEGLQRAWAAWQRIPAATT